MRPQINRRSLLSASAIAPLYLASGTLTPSTAAQSATQDSRFLFNPQNYIARGTVFTRSVANMPLASNSAQLAQAMNTMPLQYAGKSGFTWLKTSLNTVSYNIPIYVVDSSVAGCPTKSFTVDHYECKDDPVVHNAKIPCPSYAKPAWGGDMSLAIYDIATGILREYFHCTATSSGFAAATAGWTNLGTKLTATALAAKNFAMRTTKGSSSVVKMHNPLSQVGFEEVKAGVINHAVSFTFANAAPGSSWPARQGDGNFAGTAPVQGQWFRFPPELDLGTLGLKPLTLMVARAVQRYGGYGADRNTWCHSVNLESSFSFQSDSPETSLRPVFDSWRESLDLGSVVNDFPWHLTQWAPVDWNSTAQATALGNPWLYQSSDWTRKVTGTLASAGTTTVADNDLRTDATSLAGRTAAITWSRAAFSRTKEEEFEFVPRAAQMGAAVTVSVLLNNKVVATCNSRSLKSLRFKTVVGQNNLAIRFDLAAPAQGARNDVLTLGPMMPR